VTVVVCAGTGTEVGKTWVGAAVLAELRRRGLRVAARKPVQSFDPGEGGPLDAEVLAAATGEAPDAVCGAGATYEVPMAPPMAAAALGRTVPTLDDLAAALRWPSPVPDVAWVELVGGPRSPLAADGDGVDLTARIGPDVVVLVADAALGAVNAVLLASGPFLDLGLVPWVLLNRYDPEADVHRRNLAWLTGAVPGPVLTDVGALADRLAGRAVSRR
jgi:dethiobiotin synthetase